MEIIITSIIVLLACFIIYKNIRSSSKGKCSNCSSCNKKCSQNKELS